MHNKKETVIRINGESIRMREFKDFTLDVLVYCRANDVVKDGEDDAILDVVKHVTACLEEAELDEHVWLSLRNAVVICDEIAGRLMKLDPANTDVYKNNVTAYKDKLNVLDGQYKEAVSGSKIKTLLFGDRFPFRYLTDDYGLDYYAAFAGCSAETEASFETVLFLAEKVDELNLHSIMTIEGSDKKIAETIRNSTVTKDQEIRTLNSMQGITSKDIASGTSYLSVMTENLETLKQALK